MSFPAFLVLTADSEDSKFCFLIGRTILYPADVIGKDTHTDTLTMRAWQGKQIQCIDDLAVVRLSDFRYYSSQNNYHSTCSEKDGSVYPWGQE